MNVNWLRSKLPKRLRARFYNQDEMRMGSPNYGDLVLDRKLLGQDFASEFLWSEDGEFLAAQQLISWREEPVTRIVVFDTATGKAAATSDPLEGLLSPVRYESASLVYVQLRRYHADRELRLSLDAR